MSILNSVFLSRFWHGRRARLDIDRHRFIALLLLLGVLPSLVAPFGVNLEIVLHSHDSLGHHLHLFDSPVAPLTADVHNHVAAEADDHRDLRNRTVPKEIRIRLSNQCRPFANNLAQNSNTFALRAAQPSECRVGEASDAGHTLSIRLRQRVFSVHECDGAIASLQRRPPLVI